MSATMAQIRVTTRKTTIVAEESLDFSATIVFTLTSSQDKKNRGRILLYHPGICLFSRISQLKCEVRPVIGRFSRTSTLIQKAAGPKGSAA